MPASKQSRDEAVEIVVGDEIGEVVEGQRQLETEYDQLLAERKRLQEARAPQSALKVSSAGGHALFQGDGGGEPTRWHPAGERGSGAGHCEEAEAEHAGAGQEPAAESWGGPQPPPSRFPLWQGPTRAPVDRPPRTW